MRSGIAQPRQTESDLLKTHTHSPCSELEPVKLTGSAWEPCFREIASYVVKSKDNQMFLNADNTRLVSRLVRGKLDSFLLRFVSSYEPTNGLAFRLPEV